MQVLKPGVPSILRKWKSIFICFFFGKLAHFEVFKFPVPFCLWAVNEILIFFYTYERCLLHT